MKHGFIGECDSKPAEHVPAVIALLLMKDGTTGGRLIGAMDNEMSALSITQRAYAFISPAVLHECIMFEKKYQSKGLPG